MPILVLAFAMTLHLQGGHGLPTSIEGGRLLRRTSAQEPRKLDCLQFREQMESQVAQADGAKAALSYKLETTFSMATYASCRALVRSFGPTGNRDLRVEYEIRTGTSASQVQVLDSRPYVQTREDEELPNADESQPAAEQDRVMPTCGSDEATRALYNMLISEVSGSFNPYGHMSDEEVAKKVPKAFQFRGFTTLNSGPNVRSCEVTADIDVSKTTDEPNVKSALRMASPPKHITFRYRLTLSDDGRTLRATED